MYQTDSSGNVTAAPIDLGPATDQVSVYATGLARAANVRVTLS